MKTLDIIFFSIIGVVTLAGGSFVFFSKHTDESRAKQENSNMSPGLADLHNQPSYFNQMKNKFSNSYGGSKKTQHNRNKTKQVKKTKRRKNNF
tara:strand:- start:832 stop:1110 length:279 start_codon:yes stop_codon:yes gene_type:complete